MKSFSLSPTVIAALCGAWLGLPLVAQTTASLSVEPKPLEWRGSLTLQLDVHAYDGGFNDGVPEFVSRYLPMRGLNGDDYPGYYLDLSRVSLSLVDTATGRAVFGVERTALGYYNQRNALFVDGAPARLELTHSLYRSQQLRSANPVDPAGAAPSVFPNSIFAKFNDDSFGRQDYFTERNDYGFNLTIRPEAFGYTGAQIGDIGLGYAKSDRNSVRYFDYVLTRRLTGGSTWERPRWRGIDQKVKEDVNRFTLALNATPFDWIGVNYEFTVEKYEHSFNNASLETVAQRANVPITNYSAAATNTGPETFINLHNTEFWPIPQVSLGWVPSTTKVVNKAKFDKTFGRGVLNFGFASVLLKQDSFTTFATDRGFDQGEILTNSVFANWSMRLAPTVSWSAHAVQRVRENRSRFPALDPQRRLVNTTYNTSVYDYMNPLLDGGKHGGVFAPFIREIDSLKIGTDFTFVLPVANSRVVLGWVREDTSRDLIFGDPPAGQVRTIDPHEAFVRPETVSDTFFINYSGKLKSGVKLRWHNSVVLSDAVGLMTEAKKGYRSRLSASYHSAKVWEGVGVEIFHQVRYGYNNAFRISSRSNDFATLLSSAQQDQEQLLQSAGVNFNAMPSKESSLFAGYIWNRDSLEANLLYTSARRYENNWVFVSSTRDRYLSDAHTFYTGGSYQFTPKTLGTLDYSVTAIDGQLGSTGIREVLGDESAIDNIAHRLTGSLSVALDNSITVTGRYGYARYDDEVSSAYDGGFHAFSVLVTKKF